MAVLVDLIRFTTPTTGTGTLTVGGAVRPFMTPAGFGVPFNSGTTSVFYSIIDFAGGNSETGTGTYTASGTTLSRTPVASTAGGGLITLSGQAQVCFTAITSAIVNKSGDSGLGSIGFLSGSGITGTATNDNANAGVVGELISASVAVTTGAGITNNTAFNFTSISLGAGDWDVYGNGYFFGTGATVVNTIQVCLSLVSATLDGSPDRSSITSFPDVSSTAFINGSISLMAGPARLSFASGSNTVFLVGVATFSVSTAQSYGAFLRARRIR
jgi:hypothetical protein